MKAWWLGALAAPLFACSAVLGFGTFSLDPGTTPGDDGGDSAMTGDGNTSMDAGPSCETADAQTSPQHCGACNHDCLGGQCLGGQCQAKSLASGLASPEGITVTADYVFVAEYAAHRIMQYDRIAETTCTTNRGCVFAPPGDGIGTEHPTGLGTDGKSVFWAALAGDQDAPGIYGCPVAGCPALPQTVITFGQDVFLNSRTPEDLLPLQLPVKDGQIYWSQNYDGIVASITTDGATPTTYLTKKTTPFQPIDIAVGDTSIFFTVGNLGTIYAVDRQPDQAAVQVASSPAVPYGIALSGDSVFWSMERIDDVMYADGAIQSAPAAQRNMSQGVGFAPSQQNARMVQADGKNVYWIVGGAFNAASGAIMYCPLSGCPGGAPIPLASNQRAPRHLAQDDKGLYWTNEGLNGSDGEAWMIAKPVSP